jgi:hypothetical protein
MSRGQNSGSRARLCVTTMIAVVVALAVAGPASALTWAGPTQLTPMPDDSPLNAVTCISTTVCVAVGEGELESTFNPTSPVAGSATPLSLVDPKGGPNLTGPISLQAVACPSADQCTATGDQGDMMTFDPSNQTIIKDKNITQPHGTLALDDVACPSTTVCVSGDGEGNMWVFDPQSGVSALSSPSSTEYGNPNSFNGIACVSTSQCTGVNDVGHEYTFTPASPVPKPTKAAGVTSSSVALEGIACTSASQCIAGDGAGDTQTFDPTTGGSKTKKHIDGMQEMFGMSCPTATFCATVDVDGNAYEGAPPSGPFNHDVLPAPLGDLSDITCASTTECVAVDRSGELFVGGPPPTPPALLTSFGGSPIPLKGSTSMQFTVTNPNVSTSLTGVAFTDTLPAGLVVSTPNALIDSCTGGTITATAGSSKVTLSVPTLAGSGSCTFVIDVTGTSAGVKNNSVQVSSTNGGKGNTATASLTVDAPPTIAEAFGAPSIPLNGSTSLSFTITNPNASSPLNGIAFTDTLPSGLVVSTPNGLTNSCGGTTTATAASSSVSLSGATLGSGKACTFSVKVTGNSAGVKNDSVQVSSTNNGTGNTATASLTVVAPPTIAEAFGAPSIPLNGSTSLSFTISNPNSASSLSGVGFTDTLPSGLIVSTPSNGLTGSCGGGTITATAASSSVTLSGATLAASASCMFSVNVTGTSPGSKVNTTKKVSSTEGGTGLTATASVLVLAAPGIVTQASASAAVGTTVADTATLSGGVSPTGTITFKLFGPGNATCMGTAIFTTTKTVSGNGHYTSAQFTTATPGSYNWVASYGGDAKNSGSNGVCGATGESVLVTKAAPAITTQASAGVVFGGSVSDKATIGGGDAPGGTVTFMLYSATDTTCASAPVFTSSAVTVNGDGQYSSGSFTPTATGTYRWLAAYSGDANNDAESTHCGDANESVAVGQVSTATTLTSSLNPSTAGGSVTFTATVTGTSPTGTVTFKDGSTTIGTGTLDSSDAATFTSSSLPVGSDDIVAVYGGDATNATSTSTAVTQVVNASKSGSGPGSGPPSPPGVPTVTITTPKQLAKYDFGQVVRAKYSCGANGAGSTSCTGTVPNGSKINTRTPGNHTFSVKARGADGKSETRTVTYHVRLPSNKMPVLAIVANPSGSITVKVKPPRAGTLDLLVTAWKDNLAGAAYLLQPAPGRFVFARKHVVVSSAGTLSVTISPNAAGQELITHPTYRAVVRVWVSYTPTGGKQRNEGYYGLHFPSTCNQVIIPPGRPHIFCDH